MTVSLRSAGAARAGAGRGEVSGSDAPAMASRTTEFFALRSLLQLVWMFCPNRAMFVMHWSSLSPVLHVPQRMTFSVAMFLWFCLNHHRD